MIALKRAALAVALVASAACLGGAAQAQGVFRGAERGYHAGDRALGPIGGIVGGAVGTAVGGVNGALGINPDRRRHRAVRHKRVIRNR